MQFNMRKWEFLEMGMGKNNENRDDNMMHGTVLSHVIQEKDLQVVIDTGGK